MSRVRSSSQTEDLESFSGGDGWTSGSSLDMTRLCPETGLTSVWGKSAQLRFRRLGGVMSGGVFPIIHCDHRLRRAGLRTVIPNSSEKDTAVIRASVNDSRSGSVWQNWHLLSPAGAPSAVPQQDRSGPAGAPPPPPDSSAVRDQSGRHGPGTICNQETESVALLHTRFPN